jgi:alpha-glucosidase
MVWDASAHGGFTTGTPWLPVKPPQSALHAEGQLGRDGSVLEFYRRMLAHRRQTPALMTGRTQFLDLPEPVLGFLRGDDLACLFNLSAKPVVLTVHGQIADAPSHAALLKGDKLTLGANGFCHLTPVAGKLSVAG